MAEVKNAFIKSKMNKDLDSRLLPSGEYRNAINIQVSRSEGADVGAVENVLGNALLYDFEPSVANLVTIGSLADEFNGDIYVFLTDNSTENYIPAPAAGSNHFIYKYNINTNVATNLVEGAFLNFSTLYPIYGINLLETLLFWTDNRNQPRKINAQTANSSGNLTPTYYNTEDQVSVATYNPYQAIELFEASALSSGNYETTMKDVVSKYLPDGGYARVKTGVNPAQDVPIKELSINIYPNQPIAGQKVSTIDSNNVTTALGIVESYTPDSAAALSPGVLRFTSSVVAPVDTVLSISPNPYYDASYNGDPRFLEDKFVRFSYRFNFEDGEESIIAPFTQSCFIPKQDGYFLNDSVLLGDQQQAMDSSIVDFMENKVNKIGLIIPLPVAANLLKNSLHISGVDVIYKESDGLALQVIETIPIEDIEEVGSSLVYKYVYQSRKPYKTLPSKDLIRVYDKVPVKAFSQEIISNRIVYGNYQDKHTPPASLNYNISATEKSPFNLQLGSAAVTTAVSGGTTVVLNSATGSISIGDIITGAGLQVSPPVKVLTSTAGVTPTITTNINVTLSVGNVLSFSPPSTISNTTSKIEYPSSSLKTNRNYQVGVVLSDRFGRQSTTILSNSTTAITVGDVSYVGSTLYSPYIGAGVDTDSWLGNSLKVLFNDPIGPTNTIYNGDITSALYNPLGWYSYKIVVKQTEQEYYNVYTSGAMKGTPLVPASGPNPNLNTSLVVLINDNINKIPRDLAEVGAQDKSFRSSVQLFGRVQNFPNDSNSNEVNKQYYPEIISFTVSSIETLFSTFDITDPIIPTVPISSFFRATSNPFIANITTSQITANQFGVTNAQVNGDYTPIKTLAIFETKPVESRLDIFWETSTSGLINELNEAILTGSGAAGGISGFNTSGFNEAIADGGSISSNFRLVDNLGANVPAADVTSFELISVSNRQSTPQDVSQYFTLTETAANSRIYNVQVTSAFIANIFFSQSNLTTGQFNFNFRSLVNGVTTNYNELVVLKNIPPTITVAQSGSESNVFETTINTSIVGTMSAVNGAFNTGNGATGNPNRYKGLEWSIVTGSEKNSSNQVSTFFSVSQTDDVSNKKSLCSLINDNTGSIPADTYTLTIEVVDPGGSKDIVNITIKLEAILGIAKDGVYSARTQAFPIEDTFWTYVLLEVTNTPYPGFYVYYDAEYVNTGNFPDAWEELKADSGSGNIDIDRTGNRTTIVGNSCNTVGSDARRWYYATTAQGAEAAVNLFKGCVTPQGASQPQDNRIDITDTADYNFAVV